MRCITEAGDVNESVLWIESSSSAGFPCLDSRSSLDAEPPVPISCCFPLTSEAPQCSSKRGIPNPRGFLYPARSRVSSSNRQANALHIVLRSVSVMDSLINQICNPVPYRKELHSGPKGQLTVCVSTVQLIVFQLICSQQLTTAFPLEIISIPAKAKVAIPFRSLCQCILHGLCSVL